jgi:RNA-directed DNA polymerase
LPLFVATASADEPGPASDGDESSAGTERLMEEVASRASLVRALEHVVSNKGAAGVDGMTVRELRASLLSEVDRVSTQLMGGFYLPQPVRRVEIPKATGGVRKLGIPTVWDRVVQQALLQALQPRWDPTFSERSFGFRPGRSAHDAVAQARAFVQSGRTWVVDLDLERFFDHVHHDRLMAALAKRIRDKRVLKLIRRFLTAGVLEDGLVSPSVEGTPQGGPLSPLLTNVVLDELDRELTSRGHAFVRYADDVTVYVRSYAAACRVLRTVSDFVVKRLRLRVNEEKSAVGRPWERELLGFTLDPGGAAHPRVGPSPFARMKARVRELTRRWRGVSAQRVVDDLRRYLTGWFGYYGIGRAPLFDGERRWPKVDAWIRRRVRCYHWVQWKTYGRRAASLRSLGINRGLAYCSANASQGPWRMSASKAVRIALNNAYLEKLGLPSLDALAKA